MATAEQAGKISLLQAEVPHLRAPLDKEAALWEYHMEQARALASRLAENADY